MPIVAKLHVDRANAPLPAEQDFLIRWVRLACEAAQDRCAEQGKPIKADIAVDFLIRAAPDTGYFLEPRTEDISRPDVVTALRVTLDETREPAVASD